MKVIFSKLKVAAPITRIRLWLAVFMAGLFVSGLTAIPLQSELALLTNFTRLLPIAPALQHWIVLVRTGLDDTYRAYPFMAYGTDWLAFAHIVIAIAFIGPLRDPLRNVWVVEFGLIACVLIIPTAMIAGPARGIPFFWQLLDCSFGVLGSIPLWLCRRDIVKLEAAGNKWLATQPGLTRPGTKAI
jgi:hypothetical protein